VTKCSACAAAFPKGDYGALADHYFSKSEQSDADHVMWLNRFITRQKMDRVALEQALRIFFDLNGKELSDWIREKFVQRFYGKTPHPFVVALQHPSKRTLLGYVIEHQHFLRQWVRSCAYVMAKTDQIDATLYEIDNINTEFGGIGTERPSHYELLLRMGESLGMDRGAILATAPLPDTARAIAGWDEIARNSHWVETMAALHGLELIADRTLVSSGAQLRYFDPSILDKDNRDVTEATKDFLREGYEADVGHSKEALDLVDKYASEYSIVEDVQATCLRSIDLFFGYLMARLERGEKLDLEN
jgi:pyrroloquinoline-quinone synthase